MSETVLFDPQNTNVEVRDRILQAGNYTGTIETFELLEPLEKGQQYQITFRGGDGTSRRRGWIGHENPAATQIGHEFLARVFQAVGVTDKLTLTNGNKLLSGKLISFAVRGTGQMKTSERTKKQYEQTEVKYVSAEKAGLPPFEEEPAWEESYGSGRGPW